MSEDSEVFIKIFVLTILFFFGLLIIDFLVSPHTGNVAGYPIIMPGIAWIGVPAFLIIVLILYVKNRM